MPVYGYVCSKCSHEFEIEQKMSDPPRKRCPKCRSAVRKVYHPVGVVLKGSGFYKTDSRSSKRPSDSGPADTKSTETSSSESPKSGTEKSEGSKSESSASKPKDSKPAKEGGKS